MGAYPYAYAGLKSAPCVNAANVPVPCAGVHAIGKRDAEADPALFYGAYGYAAYPYAYNYAFGKSAPCVNAANVPVPCAGVHAIGKRDAEADPAYLLGAYPYAYGAYAYGAYPHAVAATPFGLTLSSNVGVCTNVSGAQVPC